VRGVLQTYNRQVVTSNVDVEKCPLSGAGTGQRLFMHGNAVLKELWHKTHGSRRMPTFNTAHMISSCSAMDAGPESFLALLGNYCQCLNTAAP
jgi:hypothetical protein